MDIFDQSFDIVVKKIERMYANIPGDSGGETVWGIARNKHPELPLWSIVDQLKKQPGFPGTINGHPEIEEAAKAFYLQEFWNKLRCPELPPRLAFLVFDSEVNEGPGTAARDLQKALGVNPDGVIGDHTIAAAKIKDGAWMVDRMCAVRAIGYTHDHQWPVFQNGWMDRVFEAHRFALLLEIPS